MPLFVIALIGETLETFDSSSSTPILNVEAQVEKWNRNREVRSCRQKTEKEGESSTRKQTSLSLQQEMVPCFATSEPPNYGNPHSNMESVEIHVISYLSAILKCF
ncbi:hypothetical protein TVAGG3_0297670 [Trichomonas vaginalis G3]|uniref:hypothetical protein n=1 Tax=Trichomonas vaginalis (strain ATCC PRA-98 / G3) TaxID=412133 RepID=UPI0021E57E72|nr:hypothetical protein TVAGG3_0297670 [Trichomonas vaginalis G3]KAI5527715.1 hypothetical protein TVAGG3_0297670 [Trichomonas vaginalis G3]